MARSLVAQNRLASLSGTVPRPLRWMAGSPACVRPIRSYTMQAVPTPLPSRRRARWGKPRACRRRCSPGTTASGAFCPGARGPGEAPDPYRVWLSEIMLQQTTVKAVLPAMPPSCAAGRMSSALAKAELGEVLAEWAGLGYYARARNLHACAREVGEPHRREVPDDRGRTAHAAGHRRLHRGGNRRDRLRRRGEPGGRQCRAGGGAALRRDGDRCRRPRKACAAGGDADSASSGPGISRKA